MLLSLNAIKTYKEILEDYLIQNATEGDIENLMATDGKVPPHGTTITAPNEKITIEWDILPQDESNYSDISNIRIYDKNLDAVLYPCLSTPNALKYYDGEIPKSDRYIWLDQKNQVLHFYFTGLLDRTPKKTQVQCGTYGNGEWNSRYITSQANFEKVTKMPDMIEAELSIECSTPSQDLGLKYPALPGTLSAFAHNDSQDDPFTSYGLMLCGSAPYYTNAVRTGATRKGHKKVRLTLFTNHKISQIHFLNGAVRINGNYQYGQTNGFAGNASNVNATSSFEYNTVTSYYASKCTKYSADFASKVKTTIYYDDKLVKEDMYSGTYGVAETHDIYL